MARLTIHTPKGAALAPGTQAQAAVEKLAAYEDICAEILAEQLKLAEKMDLLRGQGKEKSVQFRELFAKKLTNSAFLARLSVRGLDQ